jgi:hypothetical protein
MRTPLSPGGPVNAVKTSQKQDSFRQHLHKVADPANQSVPIRQSDQNCMLGLDLSPAFCLLLSVHGGGQLPADAIAVILSRYLAGDTT